MGQEKKNYITLQIPISISLLLCLFLNEHSQFFRIFFKSFRVCLYFVFFSSFGIKTVHVQIYIYELVHVQDTRL